MILGPLTKNMLYGRNWISRGMFFMDYMADGLYGRFEKSWKFAVFMDYMTVFFAANAAFFFANRLFLWVLWSFRMLFWQTFSRFLTKFPWNGSRSVLGWPETNRKTYEFGAENPCFFLTKRAKIIIYIAVFLSHPARYVFYDLYGRWLIWPKKADFGAVLQNYDLYGRPYKS